MFEFYESLMSFVQCCEYEVVKLQGIKSNLILLTAFLYVSVFLPNVYFIYVTYIC